jgi:hypothetical protein
MSQAPDGIVDSSSFNTTIATQPVGRRRGAPPRPSVSALRRLLLGLAALLAASAVASAQQAQTFKSTRPVVCGAKTYELRLITAEAPINATKARALAIALTPEDAGDGKVFGLYWMNEQNVTPTHRDDTKGTSNNPLQPYGKGLIGNQQPVVNDFFTRAGCPTTDSQVVGLQNMLGKIDRIPIALRDIVSQLKSEGVGGDETQIEEASSENRTLFNGLQNEAGLANATRQYVANVVAAPKRPEDKDGLSPEAERASLISKNLVLEIEAAILRAERNSLFGGAPLWLLLAFFITSMISLAVIALVVREHFYPQDKRLSPPPHSSTAAATPPPGTGAQASAGQAAQMRKKLEELVNAARERRRAIEAKYAEASQTGGTRNQRARAQDNAANQQAEDWATAYAELQSELGWLQLSAPQTAGETNTPDSPSTSSPVTAELSPVVRELTGKLGLLVTDVGAMKSSVDGFDAKLTEYIEASRGLQNIWWLWYGKKYTGGRTDAFVEEMEEVIALYQLLNQRCATKGEPVAQTKRTLLIALENLEHIRKTYLTKWLGGTAPLHEIAARLKIKMSQDADAVREYEAVKESLRRCYKEVKAPEAVTRLLNERAAAAEKLGKYHPGLDFRLTLDAVAANYDALTSEVKRVLPDHGGAVRELVAALATEYEYLKPEAEKAQRLETERDDLQEQLRTAREQYAAGVELVEEIALQLNFKTDYLKEDKRAITGTLDRLKRERESGVYAQLRTGLTSALMALGKATSTDGPGERAEVVEALYLDKVIKGIRELLAEMEECSGEQLWNKGLAEGFSQKWLHYLLRADLLLRTYYADRREFGLLRQAVSQTCSGILAVLHEFQVEVVEVGLFRELPGEMETESVYSGIRNLPAVRDKVGMKIMNAQAEEVVVDVTSFPYFVKGVQANRGRASLANPSAWVQL